MYLAKRQLGEKRERQVIFLCNSCAISGLTNFQVSEVGKDARTTSLKFGPANSIKTKHFLAESDL